MIWVQIYTSILILALFIVLFYFFLSSACKVRSLMFLCCDSNIIFITFTKQSWKNPSRCWQAISFQTLFIFSPVTTIKALWQLILELCLYSCATLAEHAMYRKGNWSPFNLNSIQFWMLLVDVFKAEVYFFILDMAPYTSGRVSLPAGSCFLAWSSQPLATVPSDVMVNKAAHSEKSCTTHLPSLPLTEPSLLNYTMHCILWMKEKPFEWQDLHPFTKHLELWENSNSSTINGGEGRRGLTSGATFLSSNSCS